LKYLITILTILVALQILLINNELKKIHSLYEFTPVEFTPLEKHKYKKYQLLGYTSSKAEIKEAIIEEFGYNMAKVVECESNFKINAYNPYNTNGTTDSGLFQINSVHKSNAKKLGMDLDTIEGQFQYARYLVDRNGLRDWVCARKLGLV
jgi:hypothetical protein